VDVAEVEVSLEHVRLEDNRAFVQRHRLDEVLFDVVNVREVDERGHEPRVDLQRAA